MCKKLWAIEEDQIEENPAENERVEENEGALDEVTSLELMPGFKYCDEKDVSELLEVIKMTMDIKF